MITITDDSKLDCKGLSNTFEIHFAPQLCCLFHTPNLLFPGFCAAHTTKEHEILLFGSSIQMNRLKPIQPSTWMNASSWSEANVTLLKNQCVSWSRDLFILWIPVPLPARRLQSLLVYSCKVKVNLPGSAACTFLVAHQLAWLARFVSCYYLRVCFVRSVSLYILVSGFPFPLSWQGAWSDNLAGINSCLWWNPTAGSWRQVYSD